MDWGWEGGRVWKGGGRGGIGSLAWSMTTTGKKEEGHKEAICFWGGGSGGRSLGGGRGGEEEQGKGRAGHGQVEGRGKTLWAEEEGERAREG